MPEIAEVAVYAQDISKIISNKKLTKVSFNGEHRWRNIIVPAEVRSLLRSWVGKKLELASLAKTLYLGDGKMSIQFKLGMTGMFQLSGLTPTQIARHGFICFNFGTKKDLVKLYYLDYRRFSRVSLAKPEPLAIAGYNSNGFFTRSNSEVAEIVDKLKNFNKKPKITWLLEHGVKTGVGNYLANEALGFLNLSPFTPCKDKKEAVKILSKVTEVAQQSFIHGGNSFKGGYYRLTGELGDFFNYCQFYRNEKINYYIFNGRPLYTRFSPAPGTKGLKSKG